MTSLPLRTLNFALHQGCTATSALQGKAVADESVRLILSVKTAAACDTVGFGDTLPPQGELFPFLGQAAMPVNGARLANAGCSI